MSQNAVKRRPACDYGHTTYSGTPLEFSPTSIMVGSLS
jgi:hypothetical protein